MRIKHVHINCVILALLFSTIFLSGCSSDVPSPIKVSEPNIQSEKADKEVMVAEEVVRETNKEPIGDIKEQPIVTDVRIEFQSSTSFSVGDSMDGSYLITNRGDSFSGVTVVTYTREGLDNKLLSTRKDSIGSSASDRLSAFSASDDKGIWMSSTFEVPGNYKYKVEVFTCEEIERKLGIECKDVIKTRYFKKPNNAFPAASDVLKVKVNG